MHFTKAALKKLARYGIQNLSTARLFKYQLLKMQVSYSASGTRLVVQYNQPMPRPGVLMRDGVRVVVRERPDVYRLTDADIGQPAGYIASQFLSGITAAQTLCASSKPDCPSSNGMPLVLA